MTTHLTESQQREYIRTEISPSADAASLQLANEIAALIPPRTAAGQGVVLGLASGSNPVRLYRQLIRLHHEEGLSFKAVTTFNLNARKPRRFSRIARNAAARRSPPACVSPGSRPSSKTATSPAATMRSAWLITKPSKVLCGGRPANNLWRHRHPTPLRISQRPARSRFNSMLPAQRF